MLISEITNFVFPYNRQSTVGNFLAVKGYAKTMKLYLAF